MERTCTLTHCSSMKDAAVAAAAAAKCAATAIECRLTRTQKSVK